MVGLNRWYVKRAALKKLRKLFGSFQTALPKKFY